MSARVSVSCTVVIQKTPLPKVKGTYFWGQKNISYENIEIRRSTPNDGSFVGSWIV